MVQCEMLSSVLVVGAGVGGMRAAVDLADSGYRVYLLDAAPSIGGIVAQLGFMFPTHDCILCRGTSDHGFGCSRPSISPALLDHSQHPNIEVMANTTVVGVSGEAGDFSVQVHHRPRYVDPARCTNCDECAAVCPVELASEFDAGLARHKAAYKPAIRATPNAYVVEKGPYCEPCRKCEQICPTKAIHLDEQDSMQVLHVGAIILAIGYSLYNPTASEELGYGRYPNVITGLQFERLASRSGPTEGAITRPSDGKVPRRIAWLQCVGSRDQSHPYCSSICCMYASKEAVLAKQRIPSVDCQVFIMDERAFSKEYSAYFEQSKQVWGVNYTRCRISDIKQDPHTQDLILCFQDEADTLRQERFDMAVLSVGSEPPAAAASLARELEIDLNQYGFCKTDRFEPLDTSRPGVFVAGAFATPKEIAETVMDASGAAARCMALLAGQSSTAVVQADYPPERDVTGQPPRIGVFACRCRPTIDRVVDVDQLLDHVARQPDVVCAQALDYGCLSGGPEVICAAIRDHALNRVVIGACTPRTHLALFQQTLRKAGLNPHLLEFVSLREGCAWVHGNDPARVMRKAREEMRVATARARHLQAYGKDKVAAKRSALVIGGGLAGMTAALALAEGGNEVHLVERTGRLGGNLHHLHSSARGASPQVLLESLTRRVQSHNRIAVHYNTEVAGFSGRVGGFRAQVHSRKNGEAPRTWEIEHGIAIVATGAREHRGSVHHYGEHPGIVTQLELEGQIAASPHITAGLKQVVMIQCVDPVDQQVHYCSRTCCTSTMQNAILIKKANPDCQVIVLYKDLMTYGFREELYTEARERGVLFLRYRDEDPPHVTLEQGRVQVSVKDLALGQALTFTPDMLALAMATTPAVSNVQLARILDVPLSGEGFFMENNLKLRPMDFSREGIYLAGMAHFPKHIDESISQSLAAAGRAMTYLSSNEIEVGGTIAVVDQVKCVGCLTCVRVCPFHIPKVDQRAVGVGRIVGAAHIEPSLCTGCGTCTSECPANAIQLRHYRDDQLVLADEPILGQWMTA